MDLSRDLGEVSRLNNLEVGLSRQEVPDGRAEDRQRVGDQDSRRTHRTTSASTAAAGTKTTCRMIHLRRRITLRYSRSVVLGSRCAAWTTPPTPSCHRVVVSSSTILL